LARGRWNDLDWRVSSHCNGGTCIQVAPCGGQVAIRCSEESGRELIITAAGWRRFTADIQAGLYEHIK
jgi:hypothetical protein